MVGVGQIISSMISTRLSYETPSNEVFVKEFEDIASNPDFVSSSPYHDVALYDRKFADAAREFV